MGLGDLPPEILQNIVQRVQPWSVNDLLDLKLVNRAISGVAYRASKEVLTLPVQRSSIFAERVDLLRHQLERHACLNIVQTLIITDTVTFPRYGNKQLIPYHTLLSNQDPDIGSINRGMKQHAGGFCCEEADHPHTRYRGWRALAKLLPLLTRLRLLTSPCISCMPSFVLKTLKTEACKSVELEIRSLSMDRRIVSELNTSPDLRTFQSLLSFDRLRSVGILVGTGRDEAYERFTDDHRWISPELIYVLSCMPHLTQLSLYIDNEQHMMENVPYVMLEHVIARRWSHMAALKAFHLHCNMRFALEIEPFHFRVWRHLVDWRSLTELTIAYSIQEHDLARLVRLELSSLSRLHFFTPTKITFQGGFDDPWVHSPRVISLFHEWLSQLPPLTSLTLRDAKDSETLSIITQRHGPTLVELDLNSPPGKPDYGYVLRRAQVEDIVTHCPKLQTLSVTLPRTKGDVEEATLYALLGQLPSLCTLRINLCIYPRSYTDLAHGDLTMRRAAENAFGFAEGDDRIIEDITVLLPFGRDLDITQGEFTHILHNLVVDAPLAESIFDCVMSQRPATRPSLQELRLEYLYPIDQECPVQDMLISPVIPLLQKSWIVTPGPKATQAEPIGSPALDKWNLTLRDLCLHEHLQLDILCEVWPDLCQMIDAVLGISEDDLDPPEPREDLDDEKDTVLRFADLDWESIKSRPLQPAEAIVL